MPITILNLFSLLKDKKSDKQFPIKLISLINYDRYESSWKTSWHYFHQDLLVARKIYKANPEVHVDIWSRFDWFVAHIASYRKIEVFDIRSMNDNITNIKFTQIDCTKIPKKFTWYTSSLSCLHTIEHFGLWRYWDKIDYNWHIRWLENMHKILKKWGLFYFSTPIWPQRIEFNLHRVFSAKYLVDYFKKDYIIRSFSYINDKWELFEDIKITKWWIDNNYWCVYWCWIFELQKK